MSISNATPSECAEILSFRVAAWRRENLWRCNSVAPLLLLFDLAEDVGGFGTEDLGQENDRIESGGVLAPFEEAEVGGVHVRLAAEVDQRPLPLHSQAADD